MSNIKDLFVEHYGVSPTVIAKAPGRLEILGNHTDYNEGITLSAAVDQATEFALVPVEGRICNLHDFRDGSNKEFSLDTIEDPTGGGWANYVKGVIHQLNKRGIKIGAFNGAILSTVPLSAGMSSSAALEMSAGFAFKEEFGIDIPKADWARIGQGVENEYMGANTGLLDQFSSIFGEKDAFIYSDFRTVKVVRTVNLAEGYAIVVVNSMVKHNFTGESDYNIRRRLCEGACAKLQIKFPEVKALRDVSSEMLEAGRNLLDNEEYLKAKHVVEECERVVLGTELLDKGDILGFGQLLFDSHESSRVNFDNSCPELDFLIEQAKSIPGCIGARLSGGGFGGISIHLVEEGKADEYCKQIKTAFKLHTDVDSETFICKVGEGASVVRV